jgi:hypothetical protein
VLKTLKFLDKNATTELQLTAYHSFSKSLTKIAIFASILNHFYRKSTWKVKN